MTAKNTTLNPDDLVRGYRSGLTGQDLARQFSVGLSTIWRRLHTAGITARSHRVELPIPIEEIARRYQAGDGLPVLECAYGVSRGILTNRLQEAGYHVRSCSEAMFVRQANMTPEQRKAMARAANEAVRGRPASEDRMVKTAQSRQRTLQINSSPVEQSLRTMLRERGLLLTPQLAVGRYNCDMGATDIAVEVYCGRWHFGGAHAKRAQRRYRYILNSGRHVMIVWTTRSFPLCVEAADYIVTFLEQVRSDPSMPRQYRMIRRAGEVVTSGSIHDDHLAVVPTLTLVRDRAI